MGQSRESDLVSPAEALRALAHWVSWSPSGFQDPHLAGEDSEAQGGRH